MKIFSSLLLTIFGALTFFGQSNDCSTATPISVTANCSSPTSGSTSSATQSITGCVGTADDDVWYSFVATSTTHDITVDGAVGFDAVVQLFSGSCATLVSLGCKDQTFDGGVETIYATGLTIGATYRIRVYHYYAGSGTGSFTICVTTGTPPPSNDVCTSSTLLTVNTSCSYTSSTSDGATQSLTGCAGTADDDVWFRFVATNSVQTITVDPSSNMDPVVQLFEGTCAGLTSLYCEDSGFTNGNEVISAVGLTPGSTYFIRVYDYYSSTGGDPFQICVTGAATSAPSNDEPCNAIQLPPVTAACSYLNFTTTGATATDPTGATTPLPSSCVGGSGAMIGGYSASSKDVWFSITVPSTGSVYITPQPSFGINDGVMVLYSGTCGSLTQITCADDHNYPGTANDFKPYIAATGLTPGSTVYLRYFGFGSTSGDFGICVSSPTNDACANALYICDLNGYSASTSAAYTPDRPGTGAGQMYGNNETPAGVNQVDGINTGGPFGGTTYDVNIENNSWITFTAAATTATLYVSIYDCWVGNFPSGGIQMEIFSANNCDNFVSVSNFEESSTGFTITATGLTIGQDYYLMIDGYAGDICNYTITAESGVAFPEIVASANPICSGASTTLTAPATASSYLWSPGGSTDPFIVVSPSVTTTYTCVVEGVCGYKQTLSHTVDVNQLPTLTNSSTYSTCSNVALNIPLTADLSSTYSWSAANNGSVTGETTSTSTATSITDNLINGTTSQQTVNYTITPTSTAGCAGPAQPIAVTVNPVPTMTSGNTSTICSGATLNIPLTSTVASSYSWSAASNGNITGESTSAQSSSTINNTLTNTTTSTQTVNYTVIPTSTTGSCQGASQAVTVTVHPRPAMTSSSSATICSGLSPSISLTSNVASSYSWIATSNGSVTGESTSAQSSSTINDILTNTAGTPTTVNYSVTPTSTVGSCAGNAQSVAVLVNPVPTMTSSNTDAICSGQTLSHGLTANIGSSFSWIAASNTNVGGESLSAQSGNTINNTLTNSTTSSQVVNYTVTPTATSGGCSGTGQNVAVTVNPLPNASAGSAMVIDCNNSSVVLSGSSSTAGVSYSWSGPGIVSGGGTATPTVDANGTYTLTVTNTTTLCQNTANTTVTSDLTVPTVTAVSSAATVDCNNPSITLNGTGSSSGAGYTIAWSTADGNITGSTSTLTTTADEDGTYTLTVSDNNNGCFDTQDITLSIDTISPNVNAGPDQTLTCSTTSLSLSGSSSTGGVNYSWIGPSIVSGASTATPTVNGTGIYTLTVTNPTSGCTSSQQAEVFADANIPDAQIGATTNLDCSNTSTTIAGSSSTSGVNFGWTTVGGNIVSGGSTATPSVNAPGSYTLTVTDPGNGCTNTANITISQDITNPTVTASPSATVVDCNNPSITLDGTGSSSGAGFTTTWSTSNGNITGSTSTISTTADEDGTYTLTILNTNNGCSDSQDIVLTIDTITPNVNAGTDQTLTCASPTLSLSGSSSTGGVNFSWTGPGIVSGASTATPTVNGTGIYTLTVTNPTTGCFDTDQVEVFADANTPDAQIGATTNLDCSNTSTTIAGSSSTSGVNFGWTTVGGNIVSGGATATPSVNAPGSYTLTVTDPGNGCTNTANITISQDITNPTITASPSATVVDCNNPSITLDGTGSSSGAGFTTTWSTTDGNITGSTSTISTTADEDGTYTLTILNTNNGCSDSQDIVLTIDTITPNVNAGTDQTLTCASPTLSLSGSSSTGGVNFSWTGPGIVSGASTATPTVNGTGIYTLTVTNPTTGCFDTDQVEVFADANTPDAQIGATTNLDCNNSTSVIAGSSSTSGVNFGWTTSGGNIVSGGTTATPTVDAPGSYTLTVTDPGNGCTNTASITITEDVTIPTITATPSATTVDCNNPIVTLDGTGSSSGVGFTTTWSTADGNITGSTSTLSTTADEDGTYTLTVLNTNNGCFDTQDITLSIDTASPNAAAGADVNFTCGVTTVALDGSASTGTGITYSWSGPGNITNGTSSSPDVDATGTFTLTVTGSNGCTDTDQVQVIPDSNAPVADAGANVVVTCSANPFPVTLDGTGSDSGPNITYSWSTTGAGIITNGTTNTPSVDQEGTYSITVTNTSNSCTASATVTITTDTIVPTADLTATASSVISCNSNNIATLDGTNSLGSNLVYSYTTTDGTIAAQSNGTATVTAAGTYTLTVTADNGCTDASDITVTMDTVTPMISYNAPDTLNCNVSSVNVVASGTTGVNETYAWITIDGVIVSGGATSNLVAGATGTYTLVVTNDNGCSSTLDITVENATAPVASFTATPLTGVIPLNVTTTNTSTGSGLSYNWDLGGVSTSNAFEPTVTFDNMGNYDIVLIVTDGFGCTDTTSVTIDASGEYSIVIPNIFSPNGDDDNDIFHFTLQNATDLHCVIYNRWGQLMYEFESLEGGWDGRTQSGLEASEGGYYYLLWVTDFMGEIHEYQGPFELVR
ncbi:MAG: gliding motility-associated C-terminal domain-containing protein [Flavobacteriales bacterium]|nr:gliding motility-associated C-terminal domain-containing protein [Flavobacteriales bacterium]